MYIQDVECGVMDWSGSVLGYLAGAFKCYINPSGSTTWGAFCDLRHVSFSEKLCFLGLVRCIVKCKHLLKTVLLRLEEVQMAAEEDMRHVLSYVGYGARHKIGFGDLEKKIPF